MQELIANGIIDETGKILKKEAPKAAPMIPGVGGTAGAQAGKADSVAMEALTEFHKKFGSLRKRSTACEKTT